MISLFLILTITFFIYFFIIRAIELQKSSQFSFLYHWNHHFLLESIWIWFWTVIVSSLVHEFPYCINLFLSFSCLKFFTGVVRSLSWEISQSTEGKFGSIQSFYDNGGLKINFRNQQKFIAPLLSPPSAVFKLILTFLKVKNIQYK